MARDYAELLDTLTEGVAANVKVDPAALRDLNSVAEFITVAVQ